MKRENIQMIWDDKNRYLLKKDGKNILIVIWINPSTADDKKPDATMRKVMWFAEKNWYDWFAMINIIPQRATNPKDINPHLNLEQVKTNFDVITDLMESIKKPKILLAFWNIIDNHKDYKPRLKEIVFILEKFKPTYYVIWTTKKWNPLHPSRVGYCKLKKFNIEEYLKE